MTSKESFEQNKVVRLAREIARKKELNVQRNVLVPGFCVLLPNGSRFNAATADELLRWVKAY